VKIPRELRFVALFFPLNSAQGEKWTFRTRFFDALDILINPTRICPLPYMRTGDNEKKTEKIKDKSHGKEERIL
jgi:exonuclease III